MAYVFINGYTRKYYKTINVPAEYEDFTLPYLTSNTSYGTVTCSSENTGHPAYQAFDGDSSTWWEINEGVKSATWQWVLPVEIYITGIKIQVRTGDRPNLTARVYTSSAKTQAIGNSVTTTTAGQVVTVSSIPSDGVKTNTIFIDCSSTQDYLGIGEITITAKKLVKASYSYETEGTAENYDRYVDVPNILIPVNGYTRKYYKTINVPAEYAIENYPRPVLTQNGTLGGNSFAVYASSQYNTSEDYAPYVSFKNLRGAYSAISEDGVTISESNPWEYIMYFPKAICITEINMLNRSSYPHAPQKGYIEGSNDNISYTTLCSFTNSNNDVSGTWNISIPNSNQGFYTYYKFKFTSAPTTDGIYVALGFPTWKHKVIKSPAYSYEIQSTENDYDRYEDVLNTFEVRA